MNESDITALLSRAGDHLSPDVAGLVAGGTARGRRSLRRRRVAGGMGVAAAVGALALATTLLPSGTGSTGIAGPGPAGSPSAAHPAQRELAGAGVIEKRLVAALPAGEVSGLKVRAYDDGGGVDVRLLFDGGVVRMEAERSLDRADITADPPGHKPAGCDETQYPAGVDVATIRKLRDGDFSMDPKTGARCLNWVTAMREEACVADATCWAAYDQAFLTANPCLEDRTSGGACRPSADGTWLYSGSDAGGARGRARSYADLYTPDRLKIRTEARTAGGDEPVLSVDQLTSLVDSDIWFE